MLELLSNPEVVAFGGTVGLAAFFKFIVSREPNPAEIAVEEDNTLNDASACAVYEIRLTQAKMVEASIITPEEMSTCENYQCENCEPTRALLMKKDADKVLASKVSKRSIVSQSDRFQNDREILGHMIRRPNNVPRGAHLRVGDRNLTGGHGFYDLFWTFTDSKSGRQMAVRSIDYAHEWDQYTIYDINKAIDEEWMPVLDPDTQEHLGDVRIGKFGQTEIRDPEVITNGECACTVEFDTSLSAAKMTKCKRHATTRDCCDRCGVVLSGVEQQNYERAGKKACTRCIMHNTSRQFKQQMDILKHDTDQLKREAKMIKKLATRIGIERITK